MGLADSAVQPAAAHAVWEYFDCACSVPADAGSRRAFKWLSSRSNQYAAGPGYVFPIVFVFNLYRSFVVPFLFRSCLLNYLDLALPVADADFRPWLNPAEKAVHGLLHVVVDGEFIHFHDLDDHVERRRSLALKNGF